MSAVFDVLAWNREYEGCSPYIVILWICIKAIERDRYAVAPYVPRFVYVFASTTESWKGKTYTSLRTYGAPNMGGLIQMLLNACRPSGDAFLFHSRRRI